MSNIQKSWPTARSPGGSPPDPEYGKYLDAGGELAELDPGDEGSADALDLATSNLLDLTFDVIARRIDNTNQLDTEHRDALDDMPAGRFVTPHPS